MSEPHEPRADGGGHLDDDLSALLDGELPPEEQARAAAHLQDCASCRDELAALTTTRTLLRSLPAVDPPPGFVDDLIGVRRRRRGHAVLAATAACLATFAMLTLGGAFERMPDVEADVAVMARAHAGEPMGEPTSPDAMAEPVPMVERLGGYEREQVHVDEHMVQVTYRDGSQRLTLFEGYGRLAADDDAPEAHPMRLAVDGDEAQGWMYELEQLHLLVVDAGDVVYALVTDGPGEELVAAAAELPGVDGDDGLVERTRTVLVEVGDAFGP